MRSSMRSSATRPQAWLSLPMRRLKRAVEAGHLLTGNHLIKQAMETLGAALRTRSYIKLFSLGGGCPPSAS